MRAFGAKVSSDDVGCNKGSYKKKPYEPAMKMWEELILDGCHTHKDNSDRILVTFATVLSELKSLKL